MVLFKWYPHLYLDPWAFSSYVLILSCWRGQWESVWLQSKVNQLQLHRASEQSLCKTLWLSESRVVSRLLSNIGNVYLWYQKGEEAGGRAASVTGKADVKAELGCLKGEEESFWTYRTCCKTGRRSAKITKSKKRGGCEFQPQQCQPLPMCLLSPWHQHPGAARHVRCWQQGRWLSYLCHKLFTIFSGTSVRQ